MALDAQTLLVGLLQHNYFPTQKAKKQEIPPIFSTHSLTVEVAKEIAKLDVSKNRKKLGGYDVIEYNITRFNNVPRALSIPHPKPHVDLCTSIYKNWDQISHICRNPASLIKPRSHDDGRIIIMDYEAQWQSRNRILNMAFGRKFRVKTDVSSCFSTVYSHAIPWALVGLDEAKKKANSKEEWFNQLDKFQRLCKRNETAGVPIGPATSNISAEIILEKIDQSLTENFSYVRFIDDYTCYCKTYEEAEDFIRVLSSKLKKYKMSLNVEKTQTEQLPLPTKDEWVGEVNKLIPADDGISCARACDILDAAIGLQKSYPRGSVIKYISQCLVGKVTGLDAIQFSKYLLKLCFHYPILIPVIEKPLNEAYANGNNGNSIISFYDEIMRLIEEARRNRQSDSMSWLLYYLHKLHGEVPDTIANDIIKTEDSIAISTLLLFDEHVDKVKKFVECLDVEDLYHLDNYWICIYQLFREELIANPYSDDSTFEKLKEHDVNFLVKADT